MMDIIEQTRAILLADPTVNALVGGERIFSGRLQQGVTSPSVVLKIVFERQGVTTEGGINHNEYRLQVDQYGSKYSTVRELFTAVRDRLNGYSQGNNQGFFIESNRDLYDTEAELERISSDYLAWNKEG